MRRETVAQNGRRATRSEGAIASFNLSASEEYASILARIERLELRAAGIRKTEASKAIRWIKEAIKDYGLEASDLGLPATDAHKHG